MCKIGVTKEKKARGGIQKYFQTNVQNIFKLDENYKPIDPRNWMDCKHKKYVGNYMKAHNPFA